MTIQHEAFIDLEESLATRLNNAFTRHTAKLFKKIANLTELGKYNDAFDLVNDIDVTSVVKRNIKFIEFVGMSAILLGASRIQEVSKSSFAAESKPEILDKSSVTFEIQIVTNGNEVLRKSARDLIQKEKNAEDDLKFKADKNFSKAFVSSLNKKGKAVIDIGSSLHTSRLSAWGFTQEAEILNITTYQISEVLDGRTCLVCQTMHGKTFPVQSVTSKLESWLSVDNADDLKTLAPWPRQDAKSVAALKNMTGSEVVGAGWNTPPYHPRCRGILISAGQQSVDLSIPIERPPIRVSNPIALINELLGNNDVPEIGDN